MPTIASVEQAPLSVKKPNFFLADATFNVTVSEPKPYTMNIH
jgi:hypothetical protein